MLSKTFANQLILAVLLLIWMLLFWVMFLSNFVDLASNLGIITRQIKFDSHNYAFMKQTVAVYHAGDALALSLFGLDVIAQGVVSLLFTFSFILFCRKNIAEFLLIPFIANVVLWGAFLILEEIFLAYEQEHAARELLTLAVLSLMFVQKLIKHLKE